MQSYEEKATLPRHTNWNTTYNSGFPSRISRIEEQPFELLFVAAVLQAIEIFEGIQNSSI